MVLTIEADLARVIKAGMLLVGDGPRLRLSRLPSEPGVAFGET